jgi:putative FmdB family regulatory protein
MPTYDYRCAACGHELEVFHSIREPALTKCPQCKKPRLERLIGPGAGILFKGGGFYQTDYRSESYKRGESAEKDAVKPAAETPAAPASGAADETAPGVQPKASKPVKATKKKSG